MLNRRPKYFRIRFYGPIWISSIYRLDRTRTESQFGNRDLTKRVYRTKTNPKDEEYIT